MREARSSGARTDVALAPAGTAPPIGRDARRETPQGTTMMSAWTSRAVTYAPVLLLGASALFLLMPPTARLSLWMLSEDRPVEALTFFAFMGASLMAGRLAWMHRRGFQWWVPGVYVLLALAFFGIGMEEVSWGQRWLGFETPDALRGVNRQDEVNLHNIGVLQGRSELMRLCAGLGGLLAVGAHRIPALVRVGAPAVLLSWFLIISGHALVDVFNDIVPIEPRFDFIMQRTSEMVEFLISLAALLYGWLNVRRFGGALQHSPVGQQ